MAIEGKRQPVNSSLRGKRVLLRSPSWNDMEEFLKLNRKSRSFFRGYMNPPLKAESFTNYVDRSNLDQNAFFLICRRDDEAIIGTINLSQIFYGALQSAYLGYYVGSHFARQGYATEAMSLILKHAFDRLKLHRVEANIQPTNLASIALVKRAGFTYEGFSKRYLKVCGRWRDHERWALLVDDWKALRSRK
jgi:ribosomal-protein-alanine N-acetyltransferase